MYLHFPKVKDSTFYVYSGFLKPGRHNVAVSISDQFGARQDYFYHFLVKLREEELKIFTKTHDRKLHVR